VATVDEILQILQFVKGVMLLVVDDAINHFVEEVGGYFEVLDPEQSAEHFEQEVVAELRVNLEDLRTASGDGFLGQRHPVLQTLVDEFGHHAHVVHFADGLQQFNGQLGRGLHISHHHVSDQLNQMGFHLQFVPVLGELYSFGCKSVEEFRHLSLDLLLSVFQVCGQKHFRKLIVIK